MSTRGKIELEDLGYAAAALECEGSITLSRNITKQGWHQMHVVVSIANVNRIFVEWFVIYFLEGHIYSEVLRKLSKQTIYRWKVFSSKAINFLKLVRPYMKFKGPQADLAIEMQSGRPAKLTREYKDSCWQRMKALNRGESPAETERKELETNLISDSPILPETVVCT